MSERLAVLRLHLLVFGLQSAQRRHIEGALERRVDVYRVVCATAADKALHRGCGEEVHRALDVLEETVEPCLVALDRVLRFGERVERGDYEHFRGIWGSFVDSDCAWWMSTSGASVEYVAEVCALSPWFANTPRWAVEGGN